MEDKSFTLINDEGKEAILIFYWGCSYNKLV